MLSGYICIRNAIENDYCIIEAALSLLPVVDELILCDGESTDGTIGLLEDFVKANPKAKIVTYPWPNPHQDEYFWVRWLNFARVHCKGDMSITLDADEVLDERSYPTVLRVAASGAAALFHRLNFWQDPQHLAPHNRVCGTMVARMAATDLWMCSDEPNPMHHPNARSYAQDFGDLYIFHYGFIRESAAFVKKSVAVQNMFFGSCDSRITEMEAQGKKWNERDYFDGLALSYYGGHHPEVAKRWLTARGYTV